MAASTVPLPQILPSSVPRAVPIHLTDGNGEPLRCCNVVPLDSTGETAILCGAIADHYCSSCGPVCDSCWSSHCFDSQDGQHHPVSVVVHDCIDVLTALLAHKITASYGLVLLRSFGASAEMISRVEAIEAEAAADFPAARRRPMLTSPLWTIANVQAAAELDRRKPVASVRVQDRSNVQ